MKHFSALIDRLNLWTESGQRVLTFSGMTSSIFIFLYKNFLFQDIGSKYTKQIIICPSAEEAEDFYQKLKTLETKNFSIHYFPGLEASPYLSAIPSEDHFFKRLRALNSLLSASNTLIVTTIEGLTLNVPNKSFILNNEFKIQISDVISPIDLAKKLTNLGYSQTLTVEEPGSFSRKGEIFDLYPTSGRPVRLHYFDDMIEEIFLIDPETQKTNKEQPLTEVLVSPSVGLFCQPELISNLRESIPQAKPQFKNKFEERKELFNKLSNNQLPENYILYQGLFFKEKTNLMDYLDTQSLMVFLDKKSIEENFEQYKEILNQEYQELEAETSTKNILPEANLLYDFNYKSKLKKFSEIDTEPVDINIDSEIELKQKLHLSIEEANLYIRHKFLGNFIIKDRADYISKLVEYLFNDHLKKSELILVYRSENSKNELIHLFSLQENYQLYHHKIQLIHDDLAKGFYYSSDKLLVLSDGDFFESKKTKTKKSPTKNVDLFAEQLATLKSGDFVIHSTHGVGLYKGLESIEHAGNKSDFLVIEYENRDKVYVPVYKMNLIQKYADSSAEIKVANLQSKKFEAAKARARSSAKALAFDLIRLQAERKLKKSFVYSPPDHLFKEFELSFPFDETPDQLNAINDVLDDMQRTFPMDRLVCGDVGFGKTEVAIRAAFKAVLDKKQVAILVPTTILALQHYSSFKNRLKDFPVNIEFLSRFKSAQEAKKIISDLKDGKIDIIIGTHMLLGKEIEYHDLGLVVIDEEHRFGVAHKEQLKVYRSNLHILTLTATPIPRTLQLSFMGIRDLSLIQTAPPKRQAIKTYLIHEDDLTIKNAIEKELNRGGQIYFVHNRVNDIEEMAGRIKELVPRAKIIIGHGQLPERELEKRIKLFYSGDYDILLATTIIESGIDIPRANTMIINRADNFGLAQLHQLRGRIGRSDKKAYAYLMIPPNKNLSDTAHKRLKALQTYAEIGSGFAIASSDLEIRGAGDILGAEQSGHIEAIGLELYMELLNEAVIEIKGEKRLVRKDIEVQTPELAFIPNNYISDSGTRLKYYKRLANCSDITLLEQMKDEIKDIFGHFPPEVQNLFMVLECRISLQSTGLESLKTNGKFVNLRFDRKFLESNHELRDKILAHFMSRPKVYKISPDFSVVYEHKMAMNLPELLNFAKFIASQINLC